MLWSPGDRPPSNWGELTQLPTIAVCPVDDGGSRADDHMPSDLRERRFSPIPNPYNNDNKILKR